MYYSLIINIMLSNIFETLFIPSSNEIDKAFQSSKIKAAPLGNGF